MGCGTPTHNNECLCDVRTLNVNIQISDGVHGMWMGRELADIRDYGCPWTNETILNYFEDLTKFHDKWCESIKAVHLPDLASQLQALDLDNETFSKWKIVREYVQEAYNKYRDLDLVQVLDALCISPQLWLQACTTGGFPKWFDVDCSFIHDLEKYCMDREQPVWVEMGKTLGITAQIAQNLARTFELRHKAKFGDIAGTRQQATEMLKLMALQTTDTPTAICNDVFDRTGVRFAISAVSKIRRRAKDALNVL